MTCIVGIVENGRVWIGGDSAGVAGNHCEIQKDPKVFRRGPFLMGYTDSFRMGQLLRYDLELPALPTGRRDLHEWMVSDLVPAIRELFRVGGFMTKEKDREQGGFFLIGGFGRLFEIDRNYAVCEPIHLFTATGCGYTYALGSMHTTKGCGAYVARVRIKQALAAAVEFSTGVRGPFTIRSVGKKVGR